MRPTESKKTLKSCTPKSPSKAEELIEVPLEPSKISLNPQMLIHQFEKLKTSCNKILDDHILSKVETVTEYENRKRLYDSWLKKFEELELSLSASSNLPSKKGIVPNAIKKISEMQKKVNQNLTDLKPPKNALKFSYQKLLESSAKNFLKFVDARLPGYRSSLEPVENPVAELHQIFMEKNADQKFFISDPPIFSELLEKIKDALSNYDHEIYHFLMTWKFQMKKNLKCQR
jgi:hypothetical protein